MNHVRQAAGDLAAGGSAAHDHEIQCALVDQLGVAVGVFKQSQDSRAQTLGIDHRVERKRVICCSRGIEKIGLRARGKDNEIALVDLAFLGAHAVDPGIYGVNLGQFDIDGGKLAKNLTQRKTDIARRKLRVRKLIEERLEL